MGPTWRPDIKLRVIKVLATTVILELWHEHDGNRLRSCGWAWAGFERMWIFLSLFFYNAVQSKPFDGLKKCCSKSCLLCTSSPERGASFKTRYYVWFVNFSKFDGLLIGSLGEPNLWIQAQEVNYRTQVLM